MSATHTTTRDVSSRNAVARAALGAATVAVPLLLVALLFRRMITPWSPLPGLLVIIVGLAAAALAIGWRTAWPRVFAPRPWHAALLRFLPAVCLALLALVLAIPGTHVGVLLLCGLVLIAEEVWSGRKRSGPPAQSPVRALSPEILPAGATQQITRSADRNGETLVCLLRANFAAGQQNETLHVAFCPPLLGPPTAECTVLRGAVEAKLALAETFGARLELKRRGPLLAPAEVTLRLTVRARIMPGDSPADG